MLLNIGAIQMTKIEKLTIKYEIQNFLLKKGQQTLGDIWLELYAKELPINYVNLAILILEMEETGWVKSSNNYYLPSSNTMYKLSFI